MRPDETRAGRLLRLGSGEGDEAPREGFEARVRARIATRGTDVAAAVWTDSVGRLARPALGAAVIVTAVCFALALWDRSGGDDLGLLADSDSALSSLLAGDFDPLLEQP